MDYELFLKELISARKSKGITLQKMGQALGISGQYVGYIEKGKSPLKIKDYFTMCEVLGISPAKLLYTKNENQAHHDFSNLSDRELAIIRHLVAVIELSRE